MISFDCPKCHAQLSVADEFGGQTGTCAQCGSLVSAPPCEQTTEPDLMPMWVDELPDAGVNDETKSSTPIYANRDLIEVINRNLLWVFAVLLVLVGLFLGLGGSLGEAKKPKPSPGTLTQAYELATEPVGSPLNSATIPPAELMKISRKGDAYVRLRHFGGTIHNGSSYRLTEVTIQTEFLNDGSATKSGYSNETKTFTQKVDIPPLQTERIAFLVTDSYGEQKVRWVLVDAEGRFTQQTTSNPLDKMLGELRKYEDGVQTSPAFTDKKEIENANNLQVGKSYRLSSSTTLMEAYKVDSAPDSPTSYRNRATLPPGSIIKIVFISNRGIVPWYYVTVTDPPGSVASMVGWPDHLRNGYVKAPSLYGQSLEIVEESHTRVKTTGVPQRSAVGSKQPTRGNSASPIPRVPQGDIPMRQTPQRLPNLGRFSPRTVAVVATTVDTERVARAVLRRMNFREEEPKEAEGVLVVCNTSLSYPLNRYYSSFEDLESDADLNTYVSGDRIHVYLFGFDTDRSLNEIEHHDSES